MALFNAMHMYVCEKLTIYAQNLKSIFCQYIKVELIIMYWQKAKSIRIWLYVRMYICKWPSQMSFLNAVKPLGYI